MFLLTADHVFVERRFMANGAVLVGDDGRIVAAGILSDVESLPEAAAATRTDLGRHDPLSLRQVGEAKAALGIAHALAPHGRDA